MNKYFRLARLDKPIGSWLLFFPCLWSLLIVFSSDYSASKIKLLIFFAIGTILMRGAGCTLNDIIDQELDAKIPRTAKRPIASGEVSNPEAIIFLFLQSFLGLMILLQLNQITILIGVLSIPLIILYPYMKRLINWPQLWLSMTFNIGAIMAWTSVTNSVNWELFLIYGSCFFWTLGYDTIYAQQDSKYDQEIGIYSTAVSLGQNIKTLILLSYLFTIFLLSILFYNKGYSFVSFFILGLAACHFFWQVLTLDLNNPDNCQKRFKSNREIGFIIAFAIIIN